MNYTVVIALLITLIVSYLYILFCYVILSYSYIDIATTLAIPVNLGHANKVFKKNKQKTPHVLFGCSPQICVFKC